MKILAVHSVMRPADQQTQVDHWRIWRPLRELQKHVDWQIDHVPGIIPKYPENKDLPEFTEPEMEEGLAKLKEYDIVFSSYYPDPTTYTLIKLAGQKYGLQYVLDVDDDMFAINPDNPYWLKNDHKHVYWMQRMIADNPWLVVTCEQLAGRFRDRRPLHAKDTVTVIPNYISDDYQHPPFDNGETLRIGFMGGSSHYADLHDTGVLDAVQRLMHEHKNIRYHSIGMFFDTYLPKSRSSFDMGKKGTAFLEELYPTMNYDIGIAPLEDNTFNRGKSNIKWQEYTRAGAVTVASDVGPYKPLKNGVNAMLVKENNAEAWYKALKQLIERPKLRQILLEGARKDLKDWRIEDQWIQYQRLFERVLKERESHANADHRTEQGLFAGQAK